eukprot:CAMPEP_0172408568 /NCGR_PEP_ID=MMETSP1061-20121228/75919_1 /TAXON_ID=37318 /ORGANISM="Pseudo-nitzschia pungens, Strain cf. pungens" /LENGTH=1002 /DNA_ID=CAMNT_0013144703 /DNA_START=298 /DNA_END=3306 /DNA_ORIENTATION=-
MVAAPAIRASTSDAGSVSFCEENNSVMLIPRVDPNEKPNLWFSKSEIHHNSMMSKIRELVQAKLMDLLVPTSVDDCSFDDDTVEDDEDDVEFEYNAHDDDDVVVGHDTSPGPGSADDTTGIYIPNNYSSSSSSTSPRQTPTPPHTAKEIEERILHQKAEILQDRLNEIMELPREDILAFLTSGGLPSSMAGISTNAASAAKSRPSLPSSSSSKQQQQQPQPQRNKQSNHSQGSPKSKSNSDSNSIPSHPHPHPYNWILDSDLEWKDLPPLVQVNAVEVGYTENLWNEDSQDLAVFFQPWNDLTPNQRAALRYLGHYDEASWNKDVAIMTRRRERASQTAVAVAVVATGTLNTPSSSNSNNNNNKEEKSPVSSDGGGPRGDSVPQRDVSARKSSNADDDDELTEFISNFLPEEEPEPVRLQSEEKTTEKFNNTIKKEEDDEELTEFISNFLPEEEKKEEDEELTEFISNFLPEEEPEPERQESEEKTTEKFNSTIKEEEDDEELTEFLSNFLPDVEEPESERQESKEETTEQVNNTIKEEEEDDDDDDELSEFISNFLPDELPPSQESNEGKSDHKDSIEKDDDDDEMTEFISNFLPEAQEPSVESETKESSEEDREEPKELETKEDTQTKKRESNNDNDNEELDEFISNFLPEAEEPSMESASKDSSNNDTEKPEQYKAKDETETMKQTDDSKDNDDDDELAEFTSNLLPEGQEPNVEPESKECGDNETEQPEQREAKKTQTNKGNDNDDEELAEFISNFLPEAQEAKEPNVESEFKKSREDEAERPQQDDTKEENETTKHDDDDDEMNEFISNFLPEVQESSVESETKESCADNGEFISNSSPDTPPEPHQTNEMSDHEIAQNEKVEEEEKQGNREPRTEKVVSHCGEAPIELGETDTGKVVIERRNSISQDNRDATSEIKSAGAQSQTPDLSPDGNKPSTDDPKPTLPRSNSHEDLPAESRRMWIPVVLATAVAVVALPLLWFAMNDTSSHERRRASSEL